MSRFFDLKRTLLVIPLAAVVIAGFFFLTIDRRSQNPASIRAARLLDAPGIDSARGTGLNAGNLAPDFEMSTSDGRRLRLSELRGRPVLINFWATWCGSCLTEMPDIKALQEEKGLDAFSVVAINAGEDLSSARKFIDYLQAPFTYGLDPGLVVSDAYGVYGLPVSVFIDSLGIVQATYNGHAQRPRLESYVAAAINASPPGAFPETLRLISTVPRDRILEVTKRDKGRLDFTSRSLRCDDRYCAANAIDALRQHPGVTSVHLEANRADPRLSVRYDASALSQQDAIDAVVRALESVEDPVYKTPLEVR